MNADKKDLGEQILDLIQDAIDSMDFSHLSTNIRETFEHVGREKKPRMDRQPKKKKLPAGYGKKLPGRVSGPLQTGIGAAAFALFGILSVGFAVPFAGNLLVQGILSGALLAAESVFLPLTLVGAFFLGRGIRTKRRVRRLETYGKCWDGRAFIELDELAEKSGQGRNRIRKDLAYIREQRLLPYLNTDKGETCLIFNEETYRQYEAAEEARILREQEKAKVQEDAREAGLTDAEWEAFRSLSDLVRQTTAEIAERKRKIRSAALLETVGELELLLDRIFVCVKEHPEKISRTDRLTSYYIPSILKLLRVYEDLERQPMEGENIRKTKEEIEKSMKMMNEALENMFDDLFQDVAMDVSSDIRVLEAMLAREGWLGPKL